MNLKDIDVEVFFWMYRFEEPMVNELGPSKILDCYLFHDINDLLRRAVSQADISLNLILCIIITLKYTNVIYLNFNDVLYYINP